jgi:hypothetical protein
VTPPEDPAGPPDPADRPILELRALRHELQQLAEVRLHRSLTAHEQRVWQELAAREWELLRDSD